MELNKIVDLCKQMGVSANIYYSEVTNLADIEIVSAAPIEEYFYKNCSDVESFIQAYKSEIRERLAK